MDASDWRRLRTGLRAGARSVRTAPVVFVVAVTVMTAGLTLFGAFLLLVVNVRSTAQRLGLGDEFSVVAYMAPGVTPEPAQVEDLSRRLKRIDGVERVLYVSREEALERLRKDLGSEKSVLDDLNENPLPASFELRLAGDSRSPEQVRAIAARAETVPGIDDVQYIEEWVSAYAKFDQVLRTLGWVLGGGVFIVLSVIVGGTLRLVVDLSAEEIQIQRLVGAGGLYVRLPFYVQGVLQGASGALASLAILYALFRMEVPWLGAPLQFLTGGVRPSFFTPVEMALGVVVGILLGLLGAVFWLARLEEA
jgi:cell division transport system permease protein